MVRPGAATSPPTSDASLHVGRAARGRDVTTLAAEPTARPCWTSSRARTATPFSTESMPLSAPAHRRGPRQDQVLGRSRSSGTSTPTAPHCGRTACLADPTLRYQEPLCHCQVASGSRRADEDQSARRAPGRDIKAVRSVRRAAPGDDNLLADSIGMPVERQRVGRGRGELARKGEVLISTLRQLQHYAASRVHGDFSRQPGHGPRAVVRVCNDLQRTIRSAGAARRHAEQDQEDERSPDRRP